MTKLLCTEAAIDTRKAFGQPNTEGVLPGNPNAEATAVQFGAWYWRGGLFAGNALWTSGDQSGLARTQLYNDLPVNAPFARATLSLMDLGKSSKFPGNVTLGLYAPATSDSNLGSTESNVNWTTRWSTIAPRTTPGNPPDYSRDPISSITFADSYSGFAYCNWPLRVSSGTQPSLTKLCLAMTDETVTNRWRYFGSREYQALFTNNEVPQIDSRPRLWVVQLTVLVRTDLP